MESDKHATSGSPSVTETASNQDHPRRRLIKGGLLGASVVMASLAGRSAFAHTCRTPSAYGSLNVSRPPVLVECGNSPGFWKTHPEAWPIPPNTPFDQVFPGSQRVRSANLTLMDALNEGGGGTTMCRRKVIATLLNVRAGITVDFLTEAEIKAMWNVASMGGTYVNSARGISWTADQVIAYFDSLY